jgi:hypothetical protein
MKKIKALAPNPVIVYRSPYPADVYPYSPGICLLPSGRLVASIDLSGKGMDKMPGIKVERYHALWKGKIFVSDDKGLSWRNTADFPFLHARPFADNNRVYLVGHCSDLCIACSNDEGENWSEPVFFTQGEDWHQAPCNVWYTNEYVYLVMERHQIGVNRLWAATVAPFLMRGKRGTDLTKKGNWTFASELVFQNAVDTDKIRYFGVPFLKCDRQKSVDVGNGRFSAPLGWLESNVVQFTDPRHPFCDRSGHTFHIWARAHTETTNYAAIAKVIENPDGSMTTKLEKAPSGKTMVYVPCPGGQMKFHILFDSVTKLFWLLSTQATDSMVRPKELDSERYGLPDNERQRLVLHFSKNCFDWCFAGLVDQGKTQKQARHYASMVIDKKDLHILSRSGDQDAASAHNGNIITFHTIKNFRQLVY